MRSKIIFSLKNLVLASAFMLVVFSLNMFLANHLGAESYGNVQVGLFMLIFATSTAILGSQISREMYESKHIRDKKKKNILRYTHWLFSFLYYPVRLTILIIFLIAIVLGGLHFSGLAAPHISFYLLLLTPITAAILILANIIYINHKTAIAQTILKILPGLFLIIILMNIAYLAQIQIAEYHILIALFFCYAFTLLVTVNLLFKSIPSLKLKNFTNVVPLTIKWDEHSVQLMISTIILKLFMIAPLLIAEISFVNEANVGIFAAYLIVSTFLYVISSAFLQPIKPYIINKKTRSENLVTFKKMRLLNVMISAVVAIALLIGFPYIFTLFGSAFLSNQTAFTLLVLGGFLSAIQIPATIMIYGQQDVTDFRDTVIHALIILFVLGFAFANNFGLEGLASVFLLCNMYTALRTFFMSRKLMVISE